MERLPSGEPLDVVHDSVKKQYFITDDSLQPLALKQQEIANMAEEERFTSVHNFTQRLV